MKMVKCKKCGTEHDSKFCPNCGKKTVKSISKGRKIAGIIVVILGLLMIFSVATNWEEIPVDSSPTTSDLQDDKKSTAKDTENVIYTDSNIKVSFIKVADASDYGTGLTACYLYLKVENIASETLTVSLTEAYANDSAVTVMSATPMILAPGKNSKQPFVFGYNNIVSSADEITKLEFKIMLMDEEYTIVDTTQTISVNLK